MRERQAAGAGAPPSSVPPCVSEHRAERLFLERLRRETERHVSRTTCCNMCVFRCAQIAVLYYYHLAKITLERYTLLHRTPTVDFQQKTAPYIKPVYSSERSFIPRLATVRRTLTRIILTCSQRPAITLAVAALGALALAPSVPFPLLGPAGRPSDT